MNALQKPVNPAKHRPVARRHQLRPRNARQGNTQREMIAEITLKIVVNGVLSMAAIAALIKLLPYHFSQQAKLREIRGQIQTVEQRVNRASKDLGRSFDGSQGEAIMYEQGLRSRPNKFHVLWSDKVQPSNEQ